MRVAVARCITEVINDLRVYLKEALIKTYI